MKRLLSAAVSLLLAVMIVFTVTSCGETESTTDDVIDTAPITVSPVNGDSSSKTSGSKKIAVRLTPNKVKINKRLQSKLEYTLKDKGFNGVAIVSKKGKIICWAANGTLKPNGKKKITKNTPFAIASCSKQFTAACIMILKQEGKLKVSDTLDKYFPKYKYGKRITIKNLLTMRSGIPDFLNENYTFAAYDMSKKASEKKNRKITRKWIFSHDLIYTPGTTYNYCNSDYFLLAEIVERVSGKTFNEFIKERIFAPLGMNHTGPNEDLAYSKDLAVSAKDQWDLPGVDEKKAPLTIRVRGLNVGNGGLVSTAEDMDKWLTSLRKHTILTKSSVKEMTTDWTKSGDHYGYGLRISDEGACWHVGALDYYASFTYTIPKKGYNFFAVTNDKRQLSGDIYSFSWGIINATK